MTEFETNYHSVPSHPDAEDEIETEVMIHTVPESSKSRWNHIENLDAFFTRVYQYHQESGFTCLVTHEVIKSSIYVYVMVFCIFLANCVDYPLLFQNAPIPFIHVTNDTFMVKKLTISDILVDNCVANFNSFFIVFSIFTCASSLYFIVRTISRIFQFYEMKQFYNTALIVSDHDLGDKTWHDIQRRLIEVQREQQMCIHKTELNHLDIHMRLLRHKNYMVALINKDILPIKYQVPYLGEIAFFPETYKNALEYIIFWGHSSMFDNYKLKDDYKKINKRQENVHRLKWQIFLVAIFLLLLSVFFFFWLVITRVLLLPVFAKRDAKMFSARQWTLYGAYYLRHFNELDHELHGRLNRAYNLSGKYLDTFSSPLMTIIAKAVVFFAGTVLAVLITLSLLDDDVLTVNNMLLWMSILTLIFKLAFSLVADENMARYPEVIMKKILAHTHYMPDHWKGNAHTSKVRTEFGHLFHYQLVDIVFELLGAILTPIILIFWVMPKAGELIDFFRCFTVDVVGVGDVCSFSLMDVKKHGHPHWVPDDPNMDTDDYNQAELGKTEMSLMHFTVTNPDWKPAPESLEYINRLRTYAQRNNPNLLAHLDENLFNSLNSLSSQGLDLASSTMFTMQRTFQNPYMNMPTENPTHENTQQKLNKPVGKGVSRTIGPSEPSASGLLASTHPTVFDASFRQNLPNYDVVPTELASVDMSYSALLMHDMHDRIFRSRNFGMFNPRMGRQRLENMSGIRELSHEEEDENKEMIPLLDTRIYPN